MKNPATLTKTIYYASIALISIALILQAINPLAGIAAILLAKLTTMGMLAFMEKPAKHQARRDSQEDDESPQMSEFEPQSLDYGANATVDTNPATGLPMCGAQDSAGNLYGFSDHH